MSSNQAENKVEISEEDVDIFNDLSDDEYESHISGLTFDDRTLASFLNRTQPAFLVGVIEENKPYFAHREVRWLSYPDFDNPTYQMVRSNRKDRRMDMFVVLGRVDVVDRRDRTNYWTEATICYCLNTEEIVLHRGEGYSEYPCEFNEKTNRYDLQDELKGWTVEEDEEDAESGEGDDEEEGDDESGSEEDGSEEGDDEEEESDD